MKEERIYGVFDEGYLIFKGTRYEICNEFKIVPKGFYEYLRNARRLKGKYKVSHINGDEPIEKKPTPIMKSMEEERFEYLYSMLRIYGNTTAYNFDPRPFKKKLMEKGIFCEMRNRGDHYYIEVMA